MANVSMRGLRKAFAHTEILHGIDLDVQEGEFVVLVGPSGCGKSTLLRCIAGLEDITSGDLCIGAQKVNDIPPAKRGIAMVFQSYALYPHMTVAENMAFGLRLAGMNRREIDDAVARAAQILQIEHLLARKPKALSGGQRQRVAIGRAIVRKPGVFLFDEPLSNLDAALRVQMRVELARLHRELNTTMVYVTHDQVEAMTLAHRIVVLNAGRVEQVGSPLELYKNPRNLFVAGFIGSPTMNFAAAQLVASSENGARVRLEHGAEIDVAVSARHLAQGARLTLGVRPEHLSLTDDNAPPPTAPQASVVAVEHLGDTTYIHLALPSGEAWMARADADYSPERGTLLPLHIPARKAHLFDEQGLALPRLS